MSKGIWLLILCMGFITQARVAPTVTGIAVAAQWTGAYMAYGGFGNIMKYEITNGVTTKRSVLYTGTARYATLSPDGKNVAFIKKDTSIVYMGINGGTPVTLVRGLVSPNGFLDWPTGDWLYYSRGGLEDDGSKELWKVNVLTKQANKVITFDSSRIWQFSMSNDASKACVRPVSPGGGFRFTISSSHMIFLPYDEYQFGDGCGVAMSPDGAYLMRLNNTAHAGIDFHRWATITPPSAWQNYIIKKNLTLSEMATWGSFFGMGMNNNRWSCNSPKWICLSTGWEGRGAAFGSTQVLVNWIDSQMVRTSDGGQATSMFAGQQNEAGDFWVATSTTAAQPKSPAIGTAPQAQPYLYTVVTKGKTINTLSANETRVWDLRGRSCSIKSLRRGGMAAVYMVESGK